MTTRTAPMRRAVTVPEPDEGIQWSLSPTEGIPSKGRRDHRIRARCGANDFVDVKKMVQDPCRHACESGPSGGPPRNVGVAAAKALRLSLTYGGLDAFLMNGVGPQPHGRRGTARRPSVRERCLGLRARGSAPEQGGHHRLNPATVIARRPSEGARRSNLVIPRDCSRPTWDGSVFPMPAPTTGLEPVAILGRIEHLASNQDAATASRKDNHAA